MSGPAPGWYKDPAEPSTQRYWDGEGWLGDPLPIDVTPPPGPPRAPSAVAWPPTRRITPAPAPVPAPGPAPGGRAVPPGRPRRGPLQVPPGLPYVRIVPRPYGLPVAPLGLRVLARLIDLGILLGLNVVGNGWLFYLYLSDIWPAVKALQRQMLLPNPSYAALPAVPGRAQWILTVIPLIAMALWFAYEVPAIAQRGQTIGKRVVGIKVLPLEGVQLPGVPEVPAAAVPTSLGFLRAARRWNPLGLPVLLYTCCGIGFLLQLVDAISPVLGGPLHLALHDRAAGTVVVHSGRKGHEITPIQNSGVAP
ncbi:MAG: hypothetical protein AUG44_00170 [Actinobacteria bacterium 13_1_20CM_3_71_11]|nr:MAG: hypothetical protein AUG44_00170 [Actinobacteria bacterium 13_1_20CM_3_71_11]